jgi:hypothetical protein
MIIVYLYGGVLKKVSWAARLRGQKKDILVEEGRK